VDSADEPMTNGTAASGYEATGDVRAVVDDGAVIEEVRAWLGTAGAVTVLTGAGISTDSGIPDYRGPRGVWTRDPGAERLATLGCYLADPEVRRRAWRSRLGSPVWDARPNAGHLAIAALGRGATPVTVVTQNVDGLHQQAGSEPSRVIEVHGTMRWTRCWSCSDRRPMAETLSRVEGGEDDPACELCGGILKSATISFGEQLDRVVLAHAQEAADAAAVFLALGTSLSVQPAASLTARARRRGAHLVIANAEPTPYDPIADAVLRTPLSDLLPVLLALA